MPIENILKKPGCICYYGAPIPPNRCETCEDADLCKRSIIVNVEIEFPKDLLDAIQSTLQKGQTLSQRIIELIIKGFAHEKVHAYSKPRHMQTTNPKLNSDYQNNQANSPKHPT